MKKQKFVVYAGYDHDKTFYVEYDAGNRKGLRTRWFDGLGDNVVYDTKEAAEKACAVCIQEVEYWGEKVTEFVCYVSELEDEEEEEPKTASPL